MQTLIGSANLDWHNLGFSYIEAPFRFTAYYKNDQWHAGELNETRLLTIPEASTALNYGQQVFEGIKARATADGRVAIFRPEENAARLERSARRLTMQPVPHNMFLDALQQVVSANAAFVPPYNGSGGTFYLRPLLLGIGDTLGLQPAQDYLFVVYGAPVGPYFSSGARTIRLTTCSNDRAATRGTGNIKAGGNYASSIQDRLIAKQAGYDDVLYLDSATREYIDEAGSANFFAIKGNTLITSDAETILPSITRMSLLELAKHFGMEIELRQIKLNELDDFDEVGCCGTAVVVAAISEVRTDSKVHHFSDNMGPKTTRLFEALHAIQYNMDAAIKEFNHWLTFVNI